MRSDAISHYDFGRITIGRKIYDSDVIIYPDHVDGRWWRREGHELCPNDLKEVFKTQPEVLIVGTGYMERMRVLPETSDLLTRSGIVLVAKSTREACDEYNQIRSSKKVVAALHLTC